MAEFNPDAYLAQKSQGFDPDAYLKQKGTNGEPQTSAVEAAIDGVGNGASLGYLNKLQAAVGAIPAALDPKQKYADMYDKLRKQYSDRSAQLQTEHPLAYGAGSLAGGVGSMALLPGIGVGAEVGALGKAGLAALEAAGVGAVTNPGETFGKETQESPLQVSARLKNAAIGGALGAGTSAALSGVQALPDKLQKLRETLVLKQLGANKPQAIALKKTGMLPKAEEFLYQNNLLRPGTNLGDVAEKSGEIASQTGKQIGDIHASINSDAQSLAQSGSLSPEVQAGLNETALTPDKLKQQVMDRIQSGYAGKPGGIEAEDAINKQLLNLDNVPLNNQGEIDYAKAYDFQKGLQDTINYASDSKVTNNAKKDARQTLKELLENRAKAVGNAVGPNDPRVTQLGELNPQYNVAKTVSDQTSKQATGEQVKSYIGLLPFIGGSGVAGERRREGASWEESALEGLAAAMAIKTARKYGPGVSYSLTRNVTQPAAQALAPYAAQVPNNVGRSFTPWMLLNPKGDQK